MAPDRDDLIAAGIDPDEYGRGLLWTGGVAIAFVLFCWYMAAFHASPDPQPVEIINPCATQPE